MTWRTKSSSRWTIQAQLMHPLTLIPTCHRQPRGGSRIIRKGGCNQHAKCPCRILEHTHFIKLCPSNTRHAVCVPINSCTIKMWLAGMTHTCILGLHSRAVGQAGPHVGRQTNELASKKSRKQGKQSNCEWTW